MPKYKHDWDKIPLGTRTDSELSREYKIPVGTIRAARTKRGIPRFERPRLDHEFFNWEHIEFGTMSDADLAIKHGVKASSLGNARRRRGIPSFVEDGGTPPKRAKRGIDWDDEPLLGKVPDRVLQRKLGLASASSVSRARKFRGIPKFKPPSHAALTKMYEEMLAQWDDFNAVEARYLELAKASQGAPEKQTQKKPDHGKK